MKTINNKLIREFIPCYDPSEKGIPDDETLPVLDWVEKYRNTVPAEDILWLLLRNEFVSNKDLRLFAVWCAREALSLIDNPDNRSVEACNVTERHVNGEATDEELDLAWEGAEIAAQEARQSKLVEWAVVRAARSASESAIWQTAKDTVCAAVRSALSASESESVASMVADVAMGESGEEAAAWEAAEMAMEAAVAKEAAAEVRKEQLNYLIRNYIKKS